MSGTTRRDMLAAAPRWLTDLFGEPEKKFLSQADCEALAARASHLASGGGTTALIVRSWWAGELRWALNRETLASDRRNNELRISRSIEAAKGEVSTNQIDDVSLQGAVSAAERIAYYKTTNPDEMPDAPP